MDNGVSNNELRLVFRGCQVVQVQQGGQLEKAMEMYTDLRQFDKAKELVVTTAKNVKQLVTKQADWFKTTNDPQAAWTFFPCAIADNQLFNTAGATCTNCRQPLCFLCKVWIDMIGPLPETCRQKN
ncbi:hypothetical protein EMCRGX_G000786 [Ephydatia muelleri]